MFFQEVSQILDIDEQILIIEANKLLKVKTTETKKGDGGVISPQPPVRNLELELAERLYVNNAQEEALIKDLVLYGHVVIEWDEDTKEAFTLADYLIGETSDLNIESPVFRKIYDLYKFHFINQKQVPSSTIFTSNVDEEIQKTTINWLSPKHELSDKWSNFEIFIPKYEEILDEVSYKMVLRIRIEKLKKEVAANILEIDDSSEENTDILLDQINKKQSTIKLLSEELGAII